MPNKRGGELTWRKMEDAMTTAERAEQETSVPENNVPENNVPENNVPENNSSAGRGGTGLTGPAAGPRRMTP